MSSKGLWCSLIALYALSIREAGAQLRVEQIPLSPVKSNTGFFLYGADNLKKEIPYSSINGTPFWNIEFITATIYLENGQPYSKRPVKIEYLLPMKSISSTRTVRNSSPKTEL